MLEDTKSIEDTLTGIHKFPALKVYGMDLSYQMEWQGHNLPTLVCINS